MTSEDLKMCDYVYNNVICPVCGSKITYEPDFRGLHTHKQVGCGHPEAEAIVKRREDEYLKLVRQQPRMVRLKLSQQ
jgi:hypothetical protein